MKKSNILLVLFVLLIPAGFFLYNKLMVNAYLEGNGAGYADFKRLNNENVQQYPLQPFHHLVVEGAIDQSNLAYYEPNWGFPISIQNGPEFLLFRNERFHQFIDWRQEADTLFVQVKSLKVKASYYSHFNPLHIYAPALKSVRVSKGLYNIVWGNTQDTLSVKASMAKLNMPVIQAAALRLSLDKQSQAMLPALTYGPAQLYYNLGYRCRMELPDNYLPRLHPGHLDSSATIQVNSSALAMNRAIQGAAEKSTNH